jgi:hypothetical protein
MMTSFDERVNLLRQSSENGRKPLPRVALGAVNRDGEDIENLHRCLDR